MLLHCYYCYDCNNHYEQQQAIKVIWQRATLSSCHLLWLRMNTSATGTKQVNNVQFTHLLANYHRLPHVLHGVKSAPYHGWSRLHLMQVPLGPYESASQMASRSVQQFLHNLFGCHTIWETHKPRCMQYVLQWAASLHCMQDCRQCSQTIIMMMKTTISNQFLLTVNVWKWTTNLQQSFVLKIFPTLSNPAK